MNVEVANVANHFIKSQFLRSFFFIKYMHFFVKIMTIINFSIRYFSIQKKYYLCDFIKN